MKLLIDSSTNYLFLALYENKVVDTMIRNGRNDHSETLIDCLKAFLEKNHLTTDNIDDVIVGRGPGSYTGVRISGTIAKVLCLVKEKNLFSFSTLDLLLANKIDQEGTFLARIVAKKNHSYYKIAKISNKKIEFVTTDLFDNDEALEQFQEIKEQNHFIEVNDELFEKACLMTKTIIENHLYQKEDIFSYVPNYLRNEING